jgi:hypothetical protein
MFAKSPRPDRSALSGEIEAAFKERRAPFFPAANIAGWSAALNETLVHGHLEPVVHGARHLSMAFPTSNYVRNLNRIFERMPPADEMYLPFQDVFCNDVQIVRREKTKTVLFVFCGREHKAGLPLCMIHRWLGRLPVSVVYLRDFAGLCHLAGIRSLGRNRPATLDSLRRITTSIGGQRTLCYGNSGGVFAALHYGLDLESDAVLCLSGITNVTSLFNSRLHSAGSTAQLSSVLPRGEIDLPRAYRTAKRPPRARIVYAEHNWDDRLHAKHMGDLPTVTLQAVPDTASHNVIADLIYRGEYEGVLDWLVSP